MGSSSPLVMLLKRIGGGQLQMGMDNGGSGALDNHNMEDNNDGSRGGGPSLINDEDGQVGALMGVNEDRIGHATTTSTTSAPTSASTTMTVGLGGREVLVVAFIVNT
jgi:hypothetical protein